MAAQKPAKKNAPAPKPKAAPAAAAPKEKPAKAEKPAPAPKDEKNGVTRPKAGTATGNVWAIADDLSAKLKRPATRAEVMEKAVEAQINEATVATQYQRWRVYNDVPKAEPKAKPEKAPKAEKPAKPAPKAK